MRMEISLFRDLIADFLSAALPSFSFFFSSLFLYILSLGGCRGDDKTDFSKARSNILWLFRTLEASSALPVHVCLLVYSVTQQYQNIRSD